MVISLSLSLSLSFFLSPPRLYPDHKHVVLSTRLLKSPSTATPERVQTLTIKKEDRGYSYAVVFGKCLDGNVMWVEVEDPNIRVGHQLHNCGQKM